MTAMATGRDDESWDLDITRWLYDDASGLLTQKLYADGLGTDYGYTPDGRLASRTWARGVAASYSYTNGSSLAAISYSDDTPAVSFAYDRLGRMTSATTDGVSSNANAYSLRGLLTNETVFLRDFVSSREISRTHDALGRPSGLAVAGVGDHGPPPYQVTYGYDTLGRLSSVSNAAFAAAYTYLPGGFDAGWTITLTNGTIVSRMVTRDSYRGLVTAVSNAVNGAPVSVLAYTYDALGRVVSRNSDSFGYNPRSELTAALMDTNAYSYVYDGIGNRLTATNNGVGTAYWTNPLNQYTNILCASVPPREFSPTYDLDGNMLTNGVWSYAWDGENRLAAVYSNSVLVASNAYDHMSRRIMKISRGGAETRRFVYDGWNLVQETISNQQSTITNHYVWGLDLSGTLQGAGGVGGLLAVSRDGEPFFPCYDANGNVTEYLSTNGTVVAHYEYSPFGETVAQSGPLSTAFAFRFSTKYHDPETGLVYYGYRYYAPELGRWITRDPIGEGGGANLYVHTLNSPIGRIDPFGLSCVKYWSWKAGIFSMKQIEVQSSSDIPIVEDLSDSSSWGVFRSAVSPGFENEKCQIGVLLEIHIQRNLPAKPTKGAYYYYYKHFAVAGQAALGGGRVWTTAGKPTRYSIIFHEQAHADAFFDHTKPCFDAAVNQYCGKSLTAADVQAINQAFENCQMQTADKSAEYANLAHRIHHTGYKRLFPNIGNVLSDLLDFSQQQSDANGGPYTDKWIYE